MSILQPLVLNDLVVLCKFLYHFHPNAYVSKKIIMSQDVKASCAVVSPDRHSYFVRLVTSDRLESLLHHPGIVTPSGHVLGTCTSKVFSFAVVRHESQDIFVPLHRKLISEDQKNGMCVHRLKIDPSNQAAVKWWKTAKRESATHIHLNGTIPPRVALWNVLTPDNIMLADMVEMPTELRQQLPKNAYVPGLCVTKTLGSGGLAYSALSWTKNPGLVLDPTGKCVGMQLGVMRAQGSLFVMCAPLVSFSRLTETRRTAGCSQTVVKLKTGRKKRKPEPCWTLDTKCGCKCDVIKCAPTEGQKWIFARNGMCLGPECKHPKPKEKPLVDELHVLTCSCDATLPPHMHVAGRYFCTTKCERAWKASALNEWRDSTPEPMNKDPTAEQWKGSLSGIACGNCHIEEKGSKFHRCGKCKRVAYCGLQCQKEHWKTHKKACTPHECG